MTKLNIRHLNFHCDSLAILWGCKTRLLQVYTYKNCSEVGCCKTRKAFVRLTTELALTHFTRKCRITVQRLALYCTAATRIIRTVWLPIKFARLSSHRTCDSFATLQAHLATALRVNARQACEHRTDALRLVKIYMRYAFLSWQNGRTIDVKQALSIID